MHSEEYSADNRTDISGANRLTISLFIIYLITIFWILIFKLSVRFSYMESRKVNLVPFREPLNLGEIIMNVVIFVPLGFYSGILFKKWTTGKKILFFFAVSLLVEGLQFLLRLGAFDLTDTITNTIGGAIGLMIFKGIQQAYNNEVKTQKLINTIASIGTVLMILFLILLKTNNLWIRYQ